MKDHLRKYFPERFPLEDSKFNLLKPLETAKMKHQTLSCEFQVLDLFRRSNELRLLVGAMRKYGCDFDPVRHISCETCIGCNGGYDPDTNQVVVCKNGLFRRKTMFVGILHEMIHMFDYCRAKIDFNNLKHIACTEIRAANLTFCSPIDRLNYGDWRPDFKKTHQFCVKDVAFWSVKAYSPETPEEEIRNIIDDVFVGCYNDLEPFGRRPLVNSQNYRQSYRERYYYGYV